MIKNGIYKISNIFLHSTKPLNPQKILLTIQFFNISSILYGRKLFSIKKPINFFEITKFSKNNFSFISKFSTNSMRYIFF